MNKALYINGVFEGVLKEICKAQIGDPHRACYLQPYKSSRIKLLAESNPSLANPIRLYVSTTDALSHVSYRASIIGWEEKGKISPTRLESLNAHIREFQPGEDEIYFTAPNGQACVNLISVVCMEHLIEPITVSSFIKAVDGTPLKERSRAGSWVPVYEHPDWVGTHKTVVREQFENREREETAQTMRLTNEERRERLKRAARQPEQIQILSRGFRRNPDVAAEVLLRANGRCEYCKAEAPFPRASDGSPYLEIHHRVFLANGGEDTVENAIAVCPNCHRELHFGQ